MRILQRRPRGCRALAGHMGNDLGYYLGFWGAMMARTLQLQLLFDWDMCVLVESLGFLRTCTTCGSTWFEPRVTDALNHGQGSRAKLPRYPKSGPW